MNDENENDDENELDEAELDEETCNEIRECSLIAEQALQTEIKDPQIYIAACALLRVAYLVDPPTALAALMHVTSFVARAVASATVVTVDKHHCEACRVEWQCKAN